MSSETPVPDWRITLDGRDLTSSMKPRLVELSLSEKRGGEADQLDITLNDNRGDLAIPKTGVKLHLQLGWARGTDVVVGLVDKGNFIVDAVEHSGPPDVITLRARSADLSGNMRTRREKSWHKATIGKIVGDVAARHGLTPRVAPAVAGKEVTATAQSRESDLAFLKRLGREQDAVATIKAGSLIFAPIGSGMTAGGKTIPSATIRRRMGDRHRYSLETQEEVTGVEASYHDLGSAKKKTVTAGKKGKTRKLARTYSSEAAAKAAASAEHSRAGRSPAKLTFDLALARPDLYPERRIKAEGFKQEIDAQSWLIAVVTHRLGGNGFTTAIELEGI
ncbi:MAG TPA: contractile injection system protein, VgrG/Pvc8 family [Sphingobium sp.]|uniref:contractile injection system protein, VgrG/Pvc8 family n=1 Tax=Sphingobium sp. TaxID=1912891 RepID=UPI002ED2F21C